MDAKGKLEGCYWLSFSQTYQRKGGDKYVKADPWFDAWMTVKGNNLSLSFVSWCFGRFYKK